MKSKIVGVNNYLATDIVLSDETILDLSSKFDTPFELKFMEAAAQDLPFDDSAFYRVLTTCTLLHFPDLDKVLREFRRVTKDGDLISLYLPCDPGMLHRLLRHFGSHRRMKKC